MTQNDEPEQYWFSADTDETEPVDQAERAGQPEQSASRAAQKEEPELPKFLAEPDGTDIILFVALLAMGMFSLAMIPFRAWLLTEPLAYTLLVGGYTSAVVSGANASVGDGYAWVYLLCTVVGAIKFMPIYWLMGKRWGMEFIEMSLQYMPRAHRFFQKAVKSEPTRARAWTMAFVPLGYMPGPVPGTVVNAVAGLLKIKLLVVMLINVLSILVVNGVMMWLGYRFGEPVLDVVDVVNRYLLWITLGLLALMLFQGWRRSKKKQN